MDFDRMNPLQRRLHNAACVLGADGDKYCFEQLQRDAIAEMERLRLDLEEAGALAGHYMAQRDEERARMARAVQAIGLAQQCIHAAANDHWPSFDALSDDFDDAVAEVMNSAGAVTVTPTAMRQAVAQCEVELGGDWCETCPTVDACRIRGACSPFLGK
jgi:hypothetical protein